MELGHYLVSCLELFPAWLSFLVWEGGREEEGGGVLSSQKLLWVSELMEKIVSSWLKGTCVISFRWKHMHQGKRAVMWGMHPGLWDLWMVHRWSELDQQSCVKAVLSHEWKKYQRALYQWGKFQFPWAAQKMMKTVIFVIVTIIK